MAEFDAVIIGAGHAGLHMLHKVRGFHITRATGVAA